MAGAKEVLRQYKADQRIRIRDYAVRDEHRSVVRGDRHFEKRETERPAHRFGGFVGAVDLN